MEMDFLLSEKHLARREEFRLFARAELTPGSAGFARENRLHGAAHPGGMGRPG